MNYKVVIKEVKVHVVIVNAKSWGKANEKALSDPDKWEHVDDELYVYDTFEWGEIK
jgi:hypothetical protein